MLCEVCGRAATITVRDVWELPQKVGQVYREFVPDTKDHQFCEQHKRSPTCLGQTVAVLTGVARPI